MHFMRKLPIICGIAVMALCIASIPAGAAGFDGSTPILCAFSKVLECASDFGCQASTADSLDLPNFVRIDLNKKTAVGVGPTSEAELQKTTQISVVQRLNGTIVLQGIERRGWSAVIDETTGQMALSASGDDEAFVIFGYCTSSQ